MEQNWTVVSGKKKKDEKKPHSVEYITKKTTPKTDVPEGPNPLNDQWVYWVHDINNEDWSLASYKQLFTFNTVEDFWILCNTTKNICNGMFYLMRQGYPPIWDHEKNIGGGGWTFKIDKKVAHDFWEKLACYCIGETISTNPDNIVGVSISPKVKFVTIRLWTKSSIKDATQFSKIKMETQNEAIVINFENARFTANTDANK
jgi:hypothetical protein